MPYLVCIAPIENNSVVRHRLGGFYTHDVWKTDGLT